MHSEKGKNQYIDVGDDDKKAWKRLADSKKLSKVNATPPNSKGNDYIHAISGGKAKLIPPFVSTGKFKKKMLMLGI